jgi:phytoene dehydrogenase-like protein
MKDKKVVIIGAGIGGAGLAALLAKDGAKPIVFERNNFVGGKAGSIEHKRCLVEVGIHISPRGETGPLAQIAKKTDADVGFMNKSPMLRLIYGENEGMIYQNMMHPVSLYNMYRTISPSIKELPGILRFMMLAYRIKTKKDAEPYYHISAKSVIDKYTSDPDMHAFLNFCCVMMFCISTEEASAGDWLLAFNNWITSGATAYPKGGFGAIPNAYMKVCEDAGGELHLNEKVNRIIAGDGTVQGVETDKAFYPADIIISNAGVVKTLDMAGDQHFPDSYVEKARNSIDSTGGATVIFALDAPLAKTPLNVYIPKRYNWAATIKGLEQGQIPDDMALFIVSPTVTEPDLAPEGLHLLYGGTVTPASLDEDLNNEVLDRVENRLEKLHPGLKEHTVWKERSGVDVLAAISGRGHADAIGMAQRYDQDADKRFSPRSPVNGLYIVGADTGSFGIGTELAAQSAMETHALILEDSV